MPGLTPMLENVVRQAAREFDPDRFLAALLSPPDARADLITIAAFMGEVSRIPRVAHDPRIAAIRREWWYEALGGAGATGNPVADAVIELIGRRQLDRAPLLAVIDVWGTWLEPQPFENETAAWEAAATTELGGFRSAAAILGVPVNVEARRTLGQAAESFGMTRRLLADATAPPPAVRRLPSVPAAYWIEGVRRRRDEVRARIMKAPRGLHAALRPLALIEPYLRALEGVRSGSRAAPPEITPLARAWHLWRAKLTGRI